MNILVTMGSFKDVFSPIETASIVNNALHNHNVLCVPMCDGGEYTYDVIKHHIKCKEIFVQDIINPYGKYVDSRYLVVDDTAYIISSEVLRLFPDEDRYKNPLHLSDYGLGQLCLDAIRRGYKKINLCLGGTSTVGFGMGFAQAMGTIFKDREGNIITKPITPNDLNNIAHIESKKRDDIQLLVINDGITTAYDLPAVNPQKIGQFFKDNQKDILAKLDISLSKACLLTGVEMDTPYAGNAGGICFGIETVTTGSYVKGTDFFMELFGVKEKMSKVELVITGEGRLDNVHTEKLPVSISMAAQKIGRNLLYICGQRSQEATDTVVLKYGIEDVLCCCDHYPDVKEKFIDDVEKYRCLTPIVIRQELLKRYG